jgi:hypothetical protein
MITLTTPISQSKSYCFHDYARGIFNLDYPKDQLYILFVVDMFGEQDVMKKIKLFEERWPYPDNVFCLQTSIQGNNIVNSDAVDWKKRAQIAADLRGMAFAYARGRLSDMTHIFSVGSDIILAPDSLQDLLLLNECLGCHSDYPNHLVSGLYMARGKRLPLSLHYDEKTRDWGYDDIDIERVDSFRADWTGMDVMLIEQAVYETVDFGKYDFNKYGLGEDGYFCIEARNKANADLWIHSGVRPIHAHSTGEGIAARPLPHLRIDLTCPYCGWKSRMGKVYKDVEVACGDCKKVFWADPFWAETAYYESKIPGYGQPLK